MPVEIGAKPQSDFSDPLGLLNDCHRRIERFLATLARVHQLREGGKLEPADRAPLENALAYFRDAAPRHTADEEDSLFPRLRSAPDAESAFERLDALEEDHKIAGRDHRTIDAIFRRWLEQGELPAGESRELGEALARLSALYARHIAVEDRELYPLARKLLGPHELAAVGSEMAARRGIGK